LHPHKLLPSSYLGLLQLFAALNTEFEGTL
jgi:hypothetical protein